MYNYVITYFYLSIIIDVVHNMLNIINNNNIVFNNLQCQNRW